MSKWVYVVQKIDDGRVSSVWATRREAEFWIAQVAAKRDLYRFSAWSVKF